MSSAIKYDFQSQPISVGVGSGYYMFLAEEGYSPGTLQPLYYHLDIHYRLFDKKEETDE